MEEKNNLVVFQDKKIRRTWFKEQWYFSIVDIVEVLTESINPTDYLKKLRKRDSELGIYIGTNCPQIDMPTSSGKLRNTLAGNTKDIFRIIQSITSKKAEPFKLWLAQVGYERVEEIHNPELAQDRMKQIYEQKGYSKSWIDKRLRGIAVRQDLTDEWKRRGVESQEEFSILTAEIAKASFGMTPTEYKKLKGLKKENLRDHMTDLELIFNMLGEASTVEIEKTENPQSFDEHKDASREGGKVAKIARVVLEKKIRKRIISNNNFLDEQEKTRRLER